MIKLEKSNSFGITSAENENEKFKLALALVEVKHENRQQNSPDIAIAEFDEDSILINESRLNERSILSENSHHSINGIFYLTKSFKFKISSFNNFPFLNFNHKNFF